MTSWIKKNPLRIKKPSPRVSSISTVFSIDELLIHIFELILDEEKGHTQLVGCTQICKRWSNFALQVLWKKIKNPVPILSVLGKLGQPGDEDPVVHMGRKLVRS
jgi:hypothetical protein